MSPVCSLQRPSLLHFSHYYGFSYRTHTQTDIQAETHANVDEDFTCCWRKIKTKQSTLQRTEWQICEIL